MAKARWRKKALDDLGRLDRWREEDLNLPPIGPAILMLVEEYFGKVDLQHVLPGVPVELDQEQLDIRLLLLPIGRSDPYKVFFRVLPESDVCEVRRVRHPRQKPLKKP